MIEVLPDMPEGVTGFSASGEVSADDYRDVLVPALHEAAAAGEMRIVFVIGPEFERYEPGALLEDAKTGLDMGLVHRAHWRRMAVVTDVNWVRHAVSRFGWMAPGELRCLGTDRLAEATEWVAG